MRRRDFIAGAAALGALRAKSAHGQQRAAPVVGFLSYASDASGSENLLAFHQGLAQGGFVEGRNVDILYRWADYRYDRLATLAADLVQRRVDVIVATAGAASARAAKAATATIPIVFQMGSDPVHEGIVDSLNRPGGNVTGSAFLAVELVAKRLELLHETAPAVSSVGYLINPTTPDDGRISLAQSAARLLGVSLQIVNAVGAREIELGFASLSQLGVGALLCDSDPLFYGQREQLAALASKHRLPAIYHAREIVVAGGLMSYGGNISEAYRLAGSYTGRILRGERPANLPVQQSSKVDLALNLAAARAIGITMPPALLARADEVIE
jgi:putative tryptophan/tyrosine transport system substrate-binding protein